MLLREQAPDGRADLASGLGVGANIGVRGPRIGRARNGLPHVETLTTWARGAHWVDQQWLAQASFAGLAAVGGVKLALLGHAALVVGAFGLAVIAWAGALFFAFVMTQVFIPQSSLPLLDRLTFTNFSDYLAGLEFVPVIHVISLALLAFMAWRGAR